MRPDGVFPDQMPTPPVATRQSVELAGSKNCFQSGNGIWFVSKPVRAVLCRSGWKRVAQFSEGLAMGGTQIAESQRSCKHACRHPPHGALAQPLPSALAVLLQSQSFLHLVRCDLKLQPTSCNKPLDEPLRGHVARHLGASRLRFLAACFGKPGRIICCPSPQRASMADDAQFARRTEFGNQFGHSSEDMRFSTLGPLPERLEPLVLEHHSSPSRFVNDSFVVVVEEAQLTIGGG